MTGFFLFFLQRRKGQSLSLSFKRYLGVAFLFSFSSSESPVKMIVTVKARGSVHSFFQPDHWAVDWRE